MLVSKTVLLKPLAGRLRRRSYASHSCSLNSTRSPWNFALNRGAWARDVLTLGTAGAVGADTGLGTAGAVGADTAVGTDCCGVGDGGSGGRSGTGGSGAYRAVRPAPRLITFGASEAMS